MREMKSAVARLEEGLTDVRIMLSRMDAQFPHLATKADLAEKPSKAYLWGGWRC
ncbi:MAG: hypothetical protein AB7F35_21220 [Acetobacteraceae bacterium]